MMLTYEDKLKEIAVDDERIVVMTAENMAPIRSIPQALGSRFVDTGITEQCMVGAAAGLALRGRIVVAHALAAFLTMRAFEFIRTDLGIAHLPVKLVGFVPGFFSDGNGPTHQAVEDISLMRGIPGMKIFCPSSHDELVAGLSAVIDDPSPWYIRYNARSSVIPSTTAFEIGKAEILSDGSDVGILVYGMLTQEAWEAKSELEANDISVRLINLRTVQPIDDEALFDTLVGTKLTVTLEDHFVTGGLFSIVSEFCLKNRISPNVLPFGLKNRWYKAGRLDEVLEYEGFTGHQIAKTIMEQVIDL